MKGKQAILEYLEDHDTVTSKAVAEEYGLSLNCINKNLYELEAERVVTRVSKVWRTVTYRKTTSAERLSGTVPNMNEIFAECRRSEAMQRVLTVYGRRA